MSARTHPRPAGAASTAPETTRAATPVGRMTKPLLQRSCACGDKAGASGECAECAGRKASLDRAAVGRGASPTVAPPLVHEALRSQGRPLDESARSFMESRFGHDFARVRVHTDERAAASARAVGASAYTVGEQIVFAAGRYSPASDAGRRLLAHELTHVSQSRRDGGGSAERPAASLEVSRPSDPHEQEAEETAARVMSGAPLAAEGGPHTIAAEAGPPALAAEAGPGSRGAARFVARHAARGASLYRAPAPEEEAATPAAPATETAETADAGDADTDGPAEDIELKRGRPRCEGSINIPPTQTPGFNFGIRFRYPTSENDYFCLNRMSLRAVFQGTAFDGPTGNPSTYRMELARQTSGGREIAMANHTNRVGGNETRNFNNIGRGAYAIYLEYNPQINTRIRGSVELSGS